MRLPLAVPELRSSKPSSVSTPKATSTHILRVFALAAVLVMPDVSRRLYAQTFETSAGDSITVTSFEGADFTTSQSKTGTSSATATFGPLDAKPGVQAETYAEGTAAGRRLGSISSVGFTVVDEMTDWTSVHGLAASGATFRDQLSTLNPFGSTMVLDYTLTGIMDTATVPDGNTNQAELERMLSDPTNMLPRLVVDVGAAFDGSNVLSFGEVLEITNPGPFSDTSVFNMPLQVSLSLTPFAKAYSITLGTSAELLLNNADGVAFDTRLASDFSSTLTLDNVSLVDMNGNPQSLSGIVSGSGFNYATAVPEPGSLGLLCLAGLSLLTRRRRSLSAAMQGLFDHSRLIVMCRASLVPISKAPVATGSGGRIGAEFQFPT